MLTISTDQQTAIADKLAGMHIPSGLGTKDEACSVAAINLAMTGELSDDIPGCMSQVIGIWMITIQDEMPDEIRNSRQWRELLPLAAGTGRQHENERADLIMRWMWQDVLPLMQPVADENGFGGEWRKMCSEKTALAARAANKAANKTAAKAAAKAAYKAAAYDYDASAAYAAACSAVYAANAWESMAPAELLRQMVEVSHKTGNSK